MDETEGIGDATAPFDIGGRLTLYESVDDQNSVSMFTDETGAYLTKADARRLIQALQQWLAKREGMG